MASYFPTTVIDRYRRMMPPLPEQIESGNEAGWSYRLNRALDEVERLRTVNEELSSFVPGGEGKKTFVGLPVEEAVRIILQHGADARRAAEEGREER